MSVSQRRFSSVAEAVSFSDGAIQCMRRPAWYFKSFQPQIKMTPADGRRSKSPEILPLSPQPVRLREKRDGHQDSLRYRAPALSLQVSEFHGAGIASHLVRDGLALGS